MYVKLMTWLLNIDLPFHAKTFEQSGRYIMVHSVTRIRIGDCLRLGEGSTADRFLLSGWRPHNR
jgi:hypothetical protein